MNSTKKPTQLKKRGRKPPVDLQSPSPPSNLLKNLQIGSAGGSSYSNFKIHNKKITVDSFKSSTINNGQWTDINNFGATTKASCLQPASQNHQKGSSPASLFRATFMNNYDSTGQLQRRRRRERRSSTGKILPKDVASIMRQMRQDFMGGINSPPRLPQFGLRREISQTSSKRCQDSDFLPYTYDYQDIGVPHQIPFDFTDGMPQVAFVSAANSLSIEEDANSLVNITSKIKQPEEEKATEKKAFQSKFNPHELKRRDQLLANYLWYAAYDQDLDDTIFTQSHVQSTSYQPCGEYRSLKIQGFQIQFSTPRMLQIAQNPDSSCFVRLYLITLNELLDMSLIKNGCMREPVMIQTEQGSKDFYLNKSEGQLSYDVIRCIGNFDGLPVYAITRENIAGIKNYCKFCIILYIFKGILLTSMHQIYLGFFNLLILLINNWLTQICTLNPQTSQPNPMFPSSSP